MGQISCIVVGAGHRAQLYASYAKTHPNELKIVGVADPDPVRRKQLQDEYSLDDDMLFRDASHLAEKDKLADAIINGTMDKDHVDTTIPLLEKGYDVLLEKPFALNEAELNKLREAAQRTKRKILICHVLRYAPFYQAIKKHIVEGDIGDIINIQLTEHVSYHHLAVSYLRGKWNNEDVCGGPMLLTKSCHDMDLLMWLNSPMELKSISSFGSDFQFCKEKTPVGAGRKCLVDCKIEDSCLYSAKKHYIDHPDRWSFYVWDCFPEHKKVSLQDKQKKLETDSPYGECVWMNNHNVVDHQTVAIEFSNGSTATLNMIGGTSKAERNVHIIGTKGEIKGVFDDSKYVLRKIVTNNTKGYVETEFDLNIDGDKSGMTGSHGGGDLLLVEDFVKILNGKKPSISCTDIYDSIRGHLAVFMAERSRKEHRTIIFDS